MPIVPRPAPGPAARSTASWPRASLLLALVGLVVVVVLALPVAAVPGVGGPLDCAAAQTTVRVGLVIDYGLLAGEQGAPAAPRVQCVTVNSGASGFAVLQAGGHSFRVNASGLLCAIDGFPSGSECGDRTAGGYRYWAYFRSTGSWTYASGGPGASRPGNGSVEGWHFVSGSGTPSDPPPAGPADPNQICPPPPPPTSALAPPPTAAPAPFPVPTTRGVAGSGGGVVPPPALPGAPATTSAAPGAPSGNGGAAGPTTTASPADGAAPVEAGSTPGTEPTGAAGAPGASGTVGSAPGGSSVSGGSGSEAPAETELASAPVSGSAPVGPVGGVIAAVLVVLVGGAAAARFRVSPEDR